MYLIYIYIYVYICIHTLYVYDGYHDFREEFHKQLLSALGLEHDPRLVVQPYLRQDHVAFVGRRPHQPGREQPKEWNIFSKKDMDL